MNKEEHLLILLKEECAEIIQIASKINRFGWSSTKSAMDGITNTEQLQNEIADLTGILRMLYREVPHLKLYMDDKQIFEAKVQEKISRTERYMEVSRNLGRLQL